MKHIPLFALAIVPLGEIMAQRAERPNFVWYMTEDLSKHYLRLFNDDGSGAPSPNLEHFANECIMFDNAFCNSPVSSAARSTLITGCYASRLGISLHRTLKEVNLPEDIRMFPAYLRNAGYHTSNASKTDYNCVTDSDAWDITKGKLGDWRKRKNKEQPFFHVRTNGITHESHLLFSEKDLKDKRTITNPDSVTIHPMHPDTELFRYTYATFYDCILETDREFGLLMKMLKDDGVLDDTFVFYFGDNGGSLPGTKGYTNELGLNVPLIVYVPKKWRHVVSCKPGTHCDAFVSFVDFAPTLLHLAGIAVPGTMDGSPFMGNGVSGKDLEKRDTAFGYGDRFGELYAINRTYRKGNFKYSRNYLPYHPKSLYADYRYKQAAFREWYGLFENGLIPSDKTSFFEPQGCEELYDLNNDPFELHNLADRPEYSEILSEMRNSLRHKLLDENDLLFIPECMWIYSNENCPKEYADSLKNKLNEYSDIIDLELLPFSDAKEKLIKALHSDDVIARYWAATVCASFGVESAELKGELDNLLEDKSPIVACRALVALNNISCLTDNCVTIKKMLSKVSNGAETMHILNDAAYLYWKTGKSMDISMSEILIPGYGTEARLEYIGGKVKF